MIDLSLDVDDLYSAADPVRSGRSPNGRRPARLLAVAVDAETGEERARQTSGAGRRRLARGRARAAARGRVSRDRVRGGAGRAGHRSRHRARGVVALSWAIVIGIDEYGGQRADASVRRLRRRGVSPLARRARGGECRRSSVKTLLGRRPKDRRATEGRARPDQGQRPEGDQRGHGRERRRRRERCTSSSPAMGSPRSARIARRARSSSPASTSTTRSRRSPFGRSPSSSRRRGSRTSSSSSTRAEARCRPSDAEIGALADPAPARARASRRRSSSSSTRRRRARTADDADLAPRSTAPSEGPDGGPQGQGPAKAWSWERSCYEVRWERLASYVNGRMEGGRGRRGPAR